MDNDNEFNYSADNNFKQMPKKEKKGFGKTVFIPFVSGVIGASLVVGTCFGVPSIKNNLFKLESSVNQDEKSTTSSKKTSSNNSSYNATLMNLTEYSETAVAVAESVLPSVVGITVTYNVSTFGGTTSATATGSGVVISENGYIITNNHVVNSESNSSYYQVTEATGIKVHLYGDEDDVLYDAEIIGNDSSTDLAVLKIDAEDLKAIKVGDSDNLRVGEFVMAVGNPLGLDSSITCGVISALNRIVDDEDGNKFVTIQTDAAINSGNSGGALVNSKGELIGINSMKFSGNGIEGIGFAMPINSSMDIINQLIEFGTVKRPYIGISGRNVSEELAKKYDTPVGIYVDSAEEGTPAQEAGIKKGDIITEIEGNEVSTVEELNEIKNTYEVGDKVKLKIYRDKDYIDIEVTLGDTPPQETQKGTLEDYYNQYDNNSNNDYSDIFKYFNQFGY